MISEDVMLELFYKIVSATENKKISWSPIGNGNFSCAFARSSVAIAREDKTLVHSDYTLVFYNQEGEPVGFLAERPGLPLNEGLEIFYKMVERRAYNIDETIADMNAALDQINP